MSSKKPTAQEKFYISTGPKKGSDSMAKSTKGMNKLKAMLMANTMPGNPMSVPKAKAPSKAKAKATPKTALKATPKPMKNAIIIIAKKKGKKK